MALRRSRSRCVTLPHRRTLPTVIGEASPARAGDHELHQAVLEQHVAWAGPLSVVAALHFTGFEPMGARQGRCRRFAIGFSNGSAFANAASLPETMNESWPCSAAAAPLLIGASSIGQPFAANRAANDFDCAGVIVTLMITTAPSGSVSAAPPLPNSTSSTCSALNTITISASAPRHASAAFAAARPPAFTSASTAAGATMPAGSTGSCAAANPIRSSTSAAPWMAWCSMAENAIRRPRSCCASAAPMSAA